MVARALKECEKIPCLYIRGIVPSKWIKHPDTIDYLNVKSWETEGFSKLYNELGSICTDGSGGPKATPKSITQVAQGAAVVKYEIIAVRLFTRQLECAGGQVPGRQTVPRAELWGCIKAVSAADPHLTIHIGIDASYVTRGAYSRGKLTSVTNGDLWSILFELIDGRPGQVHIYKIKSHLDERGPVVLTEGLVTVHDLLGNSLADVVAEATAAKTKPDNISIQSATFAEGHGFNVLKRIAIIQADIWKFNEGAEIFEKPHVP